MYAGNRVQLFMFFFFMRQKVSVNVSQLSNLLKNITPFFAFPQFEWYSCIEKWEHLSGLLKVLAGATYGNLPEWLIQHPFELKAHLEVAVKCELTMQRQGEVGLVKVINSEFKIPLKSLNWSTKLCSVHILHKRSSSRITSPHLFISFGGSWHLLLTYSILRISPEIFATQHF